MALAAAEKSSGNGAAKAKRKHLQVLKNHDMFYTVHLVGVQELILGEGPAVPKCAMILLAREVLMKVASDAASKVSIVAGWIVQICNDKGSVDIEKRCAASQWPMPNH